MTKIELLFREQGRSKPITFEEFNHAGWSKKEFIEYVTLCEEFRAVMISLEHTDFRKLLKINGNSWKNDWLNTSFKNLSDFLNSYFDQQIGIKGVDFSHYVQVKYPLIGGVHIDWSDIRELITFLYYSSSEDFRLDIEIMIQCLLNHNFVYPPFSPEDYSFEKLEKRKKELQEEYDRITEPDLEQVDLNSYNGVSNWIQEYYHYRDVINTTDDEIDTINDEIMERKAFDEASKKLYVYRDKVICDESICSAEYGINPYVTFKIPRIDGKDDLIKALYCKECHKVYIMYSDYETYKEKFNNILFELSPIENDNGEPNTYIFDVNTALAEKKKFDEASKVLYVYKTTPHCFMNHRHSLYRTTVNVPNINDEYNQINAQYCAKCHRLYVTYHEYEAYQKKYHNILAKIILLDGTDEYTTDYYNRRKVSDLRLCGYSVSQKSNLSDTERRALLAKLIDHHVFEKEEIITFLNMMLNTNARSPRNIEARPKWLDDLQFVLDYKINSSSCVNVDSIRSASSKIVT